MLSEQPHLLDERGVGDDRRDAVVQSLLLSLEVPQHLVGGRRPEICRRRLGRRHGCAVCAEQAAYAVCKLHLSIKIVLVEAGPSSAWIYE